MSRSFNVAHKRADGQEIMYFTDLISSIGTAFWMRVLRAKERDLRIIFELFHHPDAKKANDLKHLLEKISYPTFIFDETTMSWFKIAERTSHQYFAGEEDDRTENMEEVTEKMVNEFFTF